MRHRLWMVIAIALVALAPLVGLVVGPLRDPWVPVSDDALIALATSDVGAHTPTFGVYSRFGFHHPGPALFVTLAPALQLAGPKGLPLGAALVACASLAATAWLLWRRGGAVLGLGGGIVLALLTRSLAAEVVDPWNPWISLLPFALLLVAAWSVLCRDRWSLPIALGVASWLAQVHLGYAVMAGVLALAATGAAVAQWSAAGRVRGKAPIGGASAQSTDADAERRAWRWPAVTSLVVLGVLWFLPAIGELADEPGNLELIIRSFRDPAEPAAGFGHAVGTVARGVGIASGWLTGTDDIDPFLGEIFTAPVWYLAVPFAVAAIVAGSALVRRRRLDPGRARDLLDQALLGQAVVWVTVMTGLVSVARISGPTYHYLLRWQWVLAAFVWLTTAWTAYVAFARPDPDEIASRDLQPKLPAALLAAGLVVASLAATTAVARADLPDTPVSDAVLAVLDPTLAAVDGRGPVLVGFEGSAFGEYQSGLVAALEDRGVEVWVPDVRGLEFGWRRTQQGREPGVELVVVTGDGIDEHLARGEVPVASFDPLTPDERAELEPYRARIAQQFEDVQAGRQPSDPLSDQEQARVRELNAKGERIAVFVAP